MELNLTMGHLYGFLLMVWAAAFFTAGAQLVRLLGWILLWQLLTPVRPMWLDVPLLVCGWLLSEWMYCVYARR